MTERYLRFDIKLIIVYLFYEVNIITGLKLSRLSTI